MLGTTACLAAAMIMTIGAGCASTGRKPAGGAISRGANPEEPRKDAAVLSDETAADIARRWGVNMESLRLSAHGHLLDMRYRVIDSDKAAALGDPKAKAFLVHEATGERMAVPTMPKVGALRSTGTRLTPGSIYVMLFANRGMTVKANDLVTLEIGECRIEHLKVH